jgi:hypothetical protein
MENTLKEGARMRGKWLIVKKLAFTCTASNKMEGLSLRLCLSLLSVCRGSLGLVSKVTEVRTDNKSHVSKQEPSTYLGHILLHHPQLSWYEYPLPSVRQPEIPHPHVAICELQGPESTCDFLCPVGLCSKNTTGTVTRAL